MPAVLEIQFSVKQNLLFITLQWLRLSPVQAETRQSVCDPWWELDGLCHWAQFSWNLCSGFGCYTVLSSLRNNTMSYRAHYEKTWHHPQTKTHNMHSNTTTEGLSHGQSQHALKIGEVQPCGFRDMRADRHTHHNTLPPPLGGEVKIQQQMLLMNDLELGVAVSNRRLLWLEHSIIMQRFCYNRRRRENNAAVTDQWLALHPT